MATSFSTVQYLVLVLYVLVSVVVGLRFARSQSTVESYYLAERSAPWWAVAISIYSADVTAISYLGCAALVFSGDLQLLVGSFAQPFAALFVSWVFIPFLAKKNVFTAYEYLEDRFSVEVRTLASALFALMRGSHLSVALYAASLVLTQVMGIPTWGSLAMLGGLTTLYTVFGGMKAALWTDVIQSFVLIGGLLAVITGVAMAFHWELSSVWQIASRPFPVNAPWLAGQFDSSGHTRLFNLRTSLYQMTLWSVVVRTFLESVGSYGSDQVFVQRYLAAGSRRKMVASIVVGSLIAVLGTVLMFGAGVFLVAYYSHFLNTASHPWVAGLTDSNRVMIDFISHGLPGTLAVIVIAGLFAGTMSSFSAGLNSLSTATYIDFIVRFRNDRKGKIQGVTLARAVTCIWGLVIILVSVLIRGNDTILATLAKVMSPFGGPLLGMFLLGMLSKRANSFGVLAGAIIGASSTVFVTYFTPIHWTWYFAIGCLGGFASGYVLSFLSSPRTTNKQVNAIPNH